jgi:alpha-glucoside transport system substrate-binding protein
MRHLSVLSRALCGLTALSLFTAACGGGGGGAQPTQAPAAPAATKPPAAAPAASPAAAGSPSASPAASPAASPSAAASPSPAAKPAASPAAAAASPSPAAAAAPRAPLQLQRLGGRVSVLGTWSGSEQDSFMAMVQPFIDQTGTQVDYEGTRDLNAVLTTRVQGNNPPDLAGLPGPGPMADFARQGKLVDLSSIVDQQAMRDEYAPTWIQLGTVDNKLVGIFIKAATKGSIWYDPKTLQRFSNGQNPKTWDDLTRMTQQIQQSGATPWCVGLESGSASGWPGTDWIEDLVLRQSGPDVYQSWYQGKQAWASPELRNAFQAFGQVIADGSAYGGRQFILSTNFGDAGNPLFTNPPGCYLHHQLSAITDFFTKANPSLQPGQDFSYFPFPDINAQYSGSLEAAGDLFGMFKDTPQARQLIEYLTTPEAQAIWVKRGGALSPNKRVTADQYPDEISRNQAQDLVNAKTVVFDASDQMPDAMNQAFFTAILNFVQNPGNLDSILSDLDRTRADAYK